MGTYQVQIIEDHQLPSGITWALARVLEGVYLFITRSAFRDVEALCRLLSAAGTARAACWGNQLSVAV